MRTRKEIEEDVHDSVFIEGSYASETSSNIKLFVEILLDIRDLLQQEEISGQPLI